MKTAGPRTQIVCDKSTLNSKEHPYGNGMEAITLGVQDPSQSGIFGRPFGVFFATRRCMNAIGINGVAVEDHPFQLIKLPYGVVDPSLREPGLMSLLSGAIGDFDGGPDSAGFCPGSRWPLHGKLPWAIPDAFQRLTDPLNDGYIRAHFTFCELPVHPAHAVNVELTRTISLLTEPAYGYSIQDKWKAILPSWIMIVAHPNCTMVEDAKIMVSARVISARDSEADKGIFSWNTVIDIGKPIPEQVYFVSDLNLVDDKWFYMLVCNPEETKGFLVRYNMQGVPEQMKHGCIWKNTFGRNLGFEAGTLPIGREKAAEDLQLYLLDDNNPLDLERQVFFLTTQEQVQDAKMRIQAATSKKILHFSNGQIAAETL
ncbi:MAG: hypothetical protein NT135_00940 [Candidatus Berkelbacteria bacterium]|nr:hypothetical protein [Candidatus Berkelbacteria bacterium]